MGERLQERLRGIERIARVGLIAVALLGAFGEEVPAGPPQELSSMGGAIPDTPGVYVMPFEARCRTPDGQEVAGFGRPPLMLDEALTSKGKKCIGTDGQTGRIILEPVWLPRVKIVLPRF